jgi:phosphatidate cytidylyltransferase
MGLVVVLALTWTSLIVGSGFRYMSWRREGNSFDTAAQPHTANHHALASLRVWWILLALLSLACWAGKPGLSLFFGAASLIGLWEFHRMFVRSATDSVSLLGLVMAIGVAHYGLMQWLAPEHLLPATCISLLLAVMLQQLYSGNTHTYLRTTAGYAWAGMVIVLCLSCAVALTSLPVSASHWNAGSVGWTLYLVLITQTSDIAQALFGRKFGRRKIIPRVSPGKSWAGLAAGIVVSCSLAWGLAEPLTTLTQGRSTWEGLVVTLTGGLLIALTGFIGDLNISALKREAGLKDSSQLLPGMGGILDRVDSLTLSAPALFVYARLCSS